MLAGIMHAFGRSATARWADRFVWGPRFRIRHRKYPSFEITHDRPGLNGQFNALEFLDWHEATRYMASHSLSPEEYRVVGRIRAPRHPTAWWS